MEMESTNYLFDKEKDEAKQSTHTKQGYQISGEAELRTDKELASIAEVSHDTIFKVEKIEGKAPEEIKQKIRKGELTINKAYNYIKRQEIKERAKAEIDQLMRIKYGSAKKGQRTDLISSESDQVWTQDKTAIYLRILGF